MSQIKSTPKIFITGVTGYIAGDAFYVLFAAHPDYEYTLLVRSEEKAKKITTSHPDVRIVIGGLDDSSLLEEESARADIVIHAADSSDHEGAAKAIAAGMARGHSKDKPGFWLHTSGTGILTFADTRAERFGEGSDKVYNDWEGVEELTNLPDDAFHRNVDKIVLEAGTKYQGVVNTTILCPPTIYGSGRGPVPTRGRQAYELARAVLETSSAPIIGRGLTRWNNVHIHDLSKVFLLMVENAVSVLQSPSTATIDPEVWGPKGYFLVDNGEHVWAELSREIAKHAKAKGYVAAADDKPFAKDDAFNLAGFEAISWGTNSRGDARRARKVLHWEPVSPSIWDEVPAFVEGEKKRLNK